MKIERKNQEVFKPIIITLETEKEAQYMETIACIQKDETLKECCKIKKQPLCEVDEFGQDLNDELDRLLDC